MDGESYGRSFVISIHAPLAGSDKNELGFGWNGSDFNPRSPCGERPRKPAPRLGLCNISIHAPLAGSDFADIFRHPGHAISIHAPLAGSDRFTRLVSDLASRFQSTLPLRGATKSDVYVKTMVPISIHAPLAGSDCQTKKHWIPAGFNLQFCESHKASPLEHAKSLLKLMGAFGSHNRINFPTGLYPALIPIWISAHCRLQNAKCRIPDNKRYLFLLYAILSRMVMCRFMLLLFLAQPFPYSVPLPAKLRYLLLQHNLQTRVQLSGHPSFLPAHS